MKAMIVSINVFCFGLGTHSKRKESRRCVYVAGRVAVCLDALIRTLHPESLLVLQDHAQVDAPYSQQQEQQEQQEQLRSTISAGLLVYCAARYSLLLVPRSNETWPLSVITSPLRCIKVHDSETSAALFLLYTPTF